MWRLCLSRLDEVQELPRRKFVDERGWFLKIITGHEDHLPDSTGEVYLTLSYPGQVRGNHYHPLTAEWFTVVMGEAEVVLSDVETGETRRMVLNADEPITLYIPARVGHAFRNPETTSGIMMFAMYADRLYDAANTVPLELM